MKRILLLALLAGAGPAAADLVRIDDGSVIQGTVGAIDGGKLAVETAFAGTVMIDPERILSVETDEARLVELEDGERMTGRFTGAPSGDQLLETERRGTIVAPAQRLTALYAPGFDPDAPVWSGAAALGLSGASGNADNQSIQIRVDAHRKAPGTAVDLFLQQRFAEQNSEETENELILGGRYENDFTDNSFYFLSGSLETDEFENLDLRAIFSAGYGYRFWDRDDSAFSTLIGLGAQRQEFDTGVTDTTALLDLGYKYRRDFGTWMRFRHALNLQPQLDDPADNYRAIADFNLEVPISGDSDWLMRLGLRADYNSTPQPGVEELDTTYTVNLVYSY